MSATRRGVSTTPSRSGSSPIPSRIMRTAASILARSISAIRRPPGRRASRAASRGRGSSAARGRSELSRSRLIQTARSPSSSAGAMSWNSEAATCTCRSRSAPVCSKNRSQCPCAGLYEPASAAVISRSTGTPIASSDAARNAGSVFDRMPIRQPRERSSASDGRDLVERRPVRQRVAERLAVVVGELEPLAVRDAFERLGEHLPVGQRLPALHLRLDLVVRGRAAARRRARATGRTGCRGSHPSNRSGSRSSRTSPSGPRPSRREA